ncbi:SMI1/KNR4 family protein [Actinomadura sp. NAK00032]|uniref:SMI1/KNR4 family protein n=1 Tax=Actinomadura sp. NAK00032 TaxID=2742128 RepID=UPI00159013EB|nr:SMI1/KNR4 family protein [Actinomadura sp. NAK00032]QKW32862.1 SMI1/KNR4 family protein [Actinomadura sp. NAK00032]
MEWRPWLRRWSDEWVRSAGPEADPEVARTRWLGFAPAAEQAVAAAEARIGVRLPPAYREFLLTTDGWRDAGMFVWRMRDTSDIGWLRDLEPYWDDGWAELCEDEREGTCLSRGLLISREADAGILFLDPGSVDDSGEWAAYSLFSWRAEPPERFASFTALMEDLYAEFHRMRKPEGGTRDSWDAKVEQARLDALAGDADGADAVLAEAEDFGLERATVLRAQLQVFVGRPSGHSLGRLLHSDFVPAGFLADPLFTEEFLPLLFAQHAECSLPGRNSQLQMAMNGNDPDLHLLVGAYQARIRNGERPMTYGNPEFDGLIRDAVDEHGAEPDALWRDIDAAFAHWRPRTRDHIAPVALLADPAVTAALTPERRRNLLSRPRGDRR